MSTVGHWGFGRQRYCWRMKPTAEHAPQPTLRPCPHARLVRRRDRLRDRRARRLRFGLGWRPAGSVQAGSSEPGRSSPRSGKICGIRRGGGEIDQLLEPALAAFEAARERGETPPACSRISGSDTPPRSPCLGMLQAQISRLIDPKLLWEICFYYDERDGVGLKFVRYAVFTENEILPRMKGIRASSHGRPKTPRAGVRFAYGQVAGVAQGRSVVAQVGALSR